LQKEGKCFNLVHELAIAHKRRKGHFKIVRKGILRCARYLTLQRSRLTKLIDVGVMEFLELVE
jgi:hypothetical protein